MSTERAVATSAPLRLPEFCAHVENAFILVRPRVADLLNAALASQARSAVFAALNRLPDRRFESLLDLLTELPELSFDVNAE